MGHSMPPEINKLIKSWDNLGFDWLSEAADFILANSDWNKLIKGIKLQKDDVDVINKWRMYMVDAEIMKCKIKISSVGTSFQLIGYRGGKIDYRNSEL